MVLALILVGTFDRVKDLCAEGILKVFYVKGKNTFNQLLKKNVTEIAFFLFNFLGNFTSEG